MKRTFFEDLTKLPETFIEEWCEGISKMPVNNLSVENANHLAGLISISAEKSRAMFSDLISKDWAFSAMVKRANHSLTAIFDSKAILWLRLNADSIGMGIMFLYYSQYMAKKYNHTAIDLKFINTHVFPMGFPSDEILHMHWDLQKIEIPGVACDNAIDLIKASKSIQFEQ